MEKGKFEKECMITENEKIVNMNSGSPKPNGKTLINLIGPRISS